MLHITHTSLPQLTCHKHPHPKYNCLRLLLLSHPRPRISGICTWSTFFNSHFFISLSLLYAIPILPKSRLTHHCHNILMHSSLNNNNTAPPASQPNTTLSFAPQPYQRDKNTFFPASNNTLITLPDTIAVLTHVFNT